MAVRRLAEKQPESFAFSSENLRWAEHTIAKFPAGRQASAVIPLLWRVQDQEGWVTKPAIESIAAMLDMPMIRVLEVATFYTMFHLEPVGRRAHVQVCGTTPCMLRGAGDIMDVCRSRIHEHPHHLSADGEFSWEEVECLGACVNAPLVQIFKDTYEDLTPESFEALLDAFERGETPEPGPQADRFRSEPAAGLTSLREAGEAPLAAHKSGAAPRGRLAEDRRQPAAAETAAVASTAPQPGTDIAGGESAEAERLRRTGRTAPVGGVDPATGEAAGQKIGRVDPTGRSDEAASRAMGARAEGKDDPALPESNPSELEEDVPGGHEPDRPGPRSDRDSPRGDREG
jgi:NADH-quinone oxidoreductase subunit E